MELLTNSAPLSRVGRWVRPLARGVIAIASEFASQNARAVNLFGIATDVQTTEQSGVQFLVSDKSVSIPVIYQGQLPQEFEDGNPAIVLGEFDGTVLFANAIIVQFSSKYLPAAALSELQSYGAQITE